MRLFSLCTILSLTIATIAAQEIIAVEEWFESMKMNREIATRNLHRQRNSRRRGNTVISNNYSNTYLLKKRSLQLDSSASSFPKLEKRVKGFPPRSEIEHRVSEFNSFEADSLVRSPVILKIVHDTPDTIVPPSTSTSASASVSELGNIKKFRKAVIGEQKLQLVKKHKKKSKSKSSKAKKIAKRHLSQYAKKIHKKKQKKNHQKR